MIIDDPVIAAEHAAAVAEHAADAAADAAVAAAAEPPQPNPDALIAADVAIVTEQEATERARIEGRTAVRIAELNQEEPPWLNDIRECLTRLEAMVMAMANPQPSTPQPSVVITQDSPTIAEGNSAASEGGLAAVEPDPEPAAVEPEAVAPEPAAAPARRGPRWI